MPTYEYECTKCGKHFDKFQSITAPALTRCPTCKGKVKRLLGTGAGIIFKGSGFYQTDYRSDSYKRGKKTESASNEAASSGKSSGGDAKKSAGAPAKKD